jgi:hypothetical protein
MLILEIQFFPTKANLSTENTTTEPGTKAVTVPQTVG